MLDTTPLDLSCFFDILFHEKHASDSTKKYLLLDVASNFSSVSLIMATRKFIILLSIFFANFQCLHSRISDRWAALKDLNARCSVIAPVTFDVGAFNQIPPVDGLLKSMNYWFSLANCSVEAVKFTGNSRPNENGSYDGYIGLIQRNEVDAAILNLRPDALPYEPGKVTPPFEVADLTIVSKKKGLTFEERHEITSFLNLDVVVYVYVFNTCIFIIPVMYTFFQLTSNDRLNPRIFIRKYLLNTYSVFSVLVDQEHFLPSNAITAILALTISLFALFAILGILLNTVGAELVVKKEPPVIDSLNDLLNTTITPMVLGQQVDIEYLKSSRPGSELNHLYIRMMEEHSYKSFSLEGYGLGGLKEFLSFVTKLDNHEGAFIAFTFCAEYTREIMCASKGIPEIKDLGNKLHVSSESFATGLSTFLFSHQIHPYVESTISYTLRSALETGQATAVIQQSKWITPRLINHDGVKINRKAIECMDNIRQQDALFRPFYFRDLSSLFMIFIVSMIFCFFVALIEVIHGKKWRKYRVMPNKQMKKKRTQPMLLVHESQLAMKKNIRPITAV